MSRSTQFIGLHYAAEDHINGLQEIPSDNVSLGMFMEPYPLRKWNKVQNGTIPFEYVIEEVEQAVPWSSGPMIFTCLRVNGINIFEWKVDPSLMHSHQEYDYYAGTFIFD